MAVIDSQTPEEKRPSEVRLQDPLSAVTRAERKTLLGVSAVGIVIAKSGLVPSRISALGIEFDRADQGALLNMLAAIVGYFLLAFIVYATSDLVAWRIAYRQAMIRLRREQAERKATRTPEELDRLEQSETQLFAGVPGTWSARASQPVSMIRAAFEFGVPFMVGAFAVYALATAPPPASTRPQQPAASASGQTPAAPVGESAQPQQPNQRMEPKRR